MPFYIPQPFISSWCPIQIVSSYHLSLFLFSTPGFPEPFSRACFLQWFQFLALHSSNCSLQIWRVGDLKAPWLNSAPLEVTSIEKVNCTFPLISMGERVRRVLWALEIPLLDVFPSPCSVISTLCTTASTSSIKYAPIFSPLCIRPSPCFNMFEFLSVSFAGL